jgi:hypothetical protein
MNGTIDLSSVAAVVVGGSAVVAAGSLDSFLRNSYSRLRYIHH